MVLSKFVIQVANALPFINVTLQSQKYFIRLKTTRIPEEKDARNTGFYDKNLKQNFHQSTPSPFKKYHIEMDRFFPSVDHYNEQFW